MEIIQELDRKVQRLHALLSQPGVAMSAVVMATADALRVYVMAEQSRVQSVRVLHDPRIAIRAEVICEDFARVRTALDGLQESLEKHLILGAE